MVLLQLKSTRVALSKAVRVTFKVDRLRYRGCAPLAYHPRLRADPNCLVYIHTHRTGLVSATSTTRTPRGSLSHCSTTVVGRIDSAICTSPELVEPGRTASCTRFAFLPNQPGSNRERASLFGVELISGWADDDEFLGLYQLCKCLSLSGWEIGRCSLFFFLDKEITALANS